MKARLLPLVGALTAVSLVMTGCGSSVREQRAFQATDLYLIVDAERGTALRSSMTASAAVGEAALEQVGSGAYVTPTPTTSTATGAARHSLVDGVPFIVFGNPPTSALLVDHALQESAP
jgi:hypothetical protein